MSLDVFMNAHRIGRLRPDGGELIFAYDSAWLAHPRAVPASLSLPLRPVAFGGVAVRAAFEALLPDEPLRSAVAAGRGLTDARTHTLLAELGGDSAGALHFRRPDTPAPVTGSGSDGAMSERDVATLLRGMALLAAGENAGAVPGPVLPGSQPKIALRRRGTTWLMPAAGSPSTHILKPQIGRVLTGEDLTHSVENEWLCLELLRAMGLPVAAAAIATFADCRALVIERFDRLAVPDGTVQRLPAETCAQALGVPPPRKYEIEGGPGIAAMLDLLADAQHAAAQQDLFLQAVIAFWLLGMTSGHARNFTLLLGPRGRFALAPLYDVRSAQPALDRAQIAKSQMCPAMSLGPPGTPLARATPRDLVAHGIDADRVDRIIRDTGSRAWRAVQTVMGRLPSDFPPNIAGSIALGVTRRLRRMMGGAG